VVTAIGLLQDRGRLSVNDKVMTYLKDELPHEYDYDRRWNNTTIDMLMRHYSGLNANFLDIDLFGFTTFGEDFLAHTFANPLAFDPAEKSVYTDAAFYLLARIAEKIVGEPLENYLWKELFYPLCHGETAWSHCPHGHIMGGTGLYVRAEDMVKLGSLYLNGGVWEGRRILSESWVKTVLDRGYELKKIAPNVYAKMGMFNQMLMLLPQSRRAVAWNAHDERSFEDVISWVIANG
jgi:CubicO group peptidase (beta-lactamase class C family)